MDDSQRSSNTGNCCFQHLTEKGFVTGQVREFSRKLVKKSKKSKKSKVWKKPPKDWPEKELGPWKCPTANGKDNLDLMKKKLKYLRTQVPNSELSSSEIQKLEYYEERNMKAVNEIIHSENSLDELEKVKNFLLNIKGEAPYIHANLIQMEIQIKDIASLLADRFTSDKVNNPVPSNATVTRSRKRRCPTSAAPKVTPAKRRSDPVHIAPKPGPAANLVPLLQITSHIPNHQPYDSVRLAGLSDNISKSTTPTTSSVTLQGPQFIFLCNPPQSISHNQDVAHPDVSTEHDNLVINTVTDTSSRPPPVSSPQHHTISSTLPTQSPEPPHENNKTEPNSVSSTPCQLRAMAQHDYESSIQDDTCQQTSTSCSVDSGVLSVGSPSSSCKNVAAKSYSVDSGITSKEIHSTDTESKASVGPCNDQLGIQFYEDNFKNLDVLGLLENITSVGSPSTDSATERGCPINIGITSLGTASTDTNRSCSDDSGIIYEGAPYADTETEASVGFDDDHRNIQSFGNSLDNSLEDLLRSNFIEIYNMCENIESGNFPESTDLDMKGYYSE